MKLDIETWTSNKGNSEVHHFIAGTQTYVFGVNKELLGEDGYYAVKGFILDWIYENGCNNIGAGSDI